MTKNEYIAEINKTLAAQGEDTAMALATKLGMAWVAKKIQLGEWDLKHKPAERVRYFQKVVDIHDGKELVKVTDSTGRFEQYVLRWDVTSDSEDGTRELRFVRTEPLGRITIGEARTRLGKMIEPQKPVGYGQKTNVGNSDNKNVGGGKQKAA